MPRLRLPTVLARQQVPMGHHARLMQRQSPWHGIDGLFLSDDLIKILNLPGQGVLVQRVVPDSTGARLGLRGGFVKATIGNRTVILGGDGMLKAQGVPIGAAHRLREQLRRVGPGDTLAVPIMREGRLQEVDGAPMTWLQDLDGTRRSRPQRTVRCSQ